MPSNVHIDPSARINVTEFLEIGEGSTIGHGVLIEGRRIKLGRQTWIDEFSHIGGGSCFEPQSTLDTGDFLHMGKFSHINTARAIRIGDEVGIGIGTKIFSHGAYLPASDGFPYQFSPVTIGSRVWLPNAWVNPGVTIGDDVVVAAMSLVNRDLPKGCFAGGIPVKILREGAFPREISSDERDLLFQEIRAVFGGELTLRDDTLTTSGGVREQTRFDMAGRTIQGPVTEPSERLRNILRRFGIRFRYSVVKDEYVPWL